MKKVVARIAAVLSALSFGAGLTVGIGIMLAPAGKFVELAIMLGLLAIWTGNLVSCLCNILCLWIGARPRWLKVVTGFQMAVTIVIPAAALWVRGGVW